MRSWKTHSRNFK